MSYVRISPNIFRFEHSTGSKCSKNNCSRHIISNSGQKQALFLRVNYKGRGKPKNKFSMKKKNGLKRVSDATIMRSFFVVSFLRRPQGNLDGSKQRKEFPFSHKNKLLSSLIPVAAHRFGYTYIIHPVVFPMLDMDIERSCHSPFYKYSLWSAISNGQYVNGVAKPAYDL